MWLSVIGNSDIVDGRECEVYQPSKDWVLTELILDAHPTLGISKIKTTFSTDYGVVNESEKQEVFEFG